ncbi:MAG: carboxy terminal-processing peptidase [Flavobacteriales bacterium]|nr:carboxy terminal-processing peptidase [Flavobacteriales bacterium]
MNTKAKIFLFGLFAFLFILSTSYTRENFAEASVESIQFEMDEDQPSKKKVLLDMLTDGLQRNHYAPATLNDTYSENVYNLYLKRIDNRKRFLLQSDVDELNKFKHEIDDQIKEVNVDFFEMSDAMLLKGMEEGRGFYKEILAEPFDFTIEESYDLDMENQAWPASIGEQRDLWRKTLKHAALSRLVDKLEEQEIAKEENDTSVTIVSFEELEESARSKVLNSYDNFYNRLDKLESEDRFADFLNVLVNVYDPHTGYYPPKDKANFDIYMSGQLEGIGAQLREVDGKIKVSRIVSGSASWKQGQLKAGDIIYAVAQEGEDMVDVTDMRLDNAVQLIRGKKGTEVRLKVKKVDGSFIVIPIIRDVVILEETYAKSVLLQNNMRAGYILLPKFYMDMNHSGGRSCAADIKIELEKLQAEGVDGIILDLRNNGGGSLQDAVKMAGFFIEEGPIVQVKGRFGKPMVLADTDPAVYYDGPLVILVNNFSVSASEIVAAALQDYDRAIIIGSEFTYGKGTVQRFLNLDNFISGGASDLRPLGSLKLSTQKFYRINGGATQLKGVASDVVLPDPYAYLELGEKELDNHLIWDEIEPASYYKSGSVTNLENIQKKSQMRLSKLESFGLMQENARRLEHQQDETIIYLSLDRYREELDAVAEEAKKYKNIQKDSTGLTVIQIPADFEVMQGDTVKIERAKSWHEKLSRDIYVFEATEILKDMYFSNTGVMPKSQ